MNPTYQCNSCAITGICQHREEFQKIVDHRCEMMVKIAGENGEIDLSKKATIRVEHRYLDGPGLEKLYRELGLMKPSSCGTLGLNRCPYATDKRPYDDQYAYFGNEQPYNARRVNCDGSVPSVWDCSGCDMYSRVSDIDYAKLGGTLFSTFGMNEVETFIGETVKLRDIPTPTSMMNNYIRYDDRNPETIEAETANAHLIIYYVYAHPVKPVKPYEYMTEDEITQKGLRHLVEFFYNEMSYVYPSLRAGEEIYPMNIKLDGILAGIGRVDNMGNVIAEPGSLVSFGKEKLPEQTLRTIFGETLVTYKEEAIASSVGYMYTSIVSDTISRIRTNNVKLEEAIVHGRSLDISKGNYRKCQFVEGDTLLMRIEIPAAYRLHFQTMMMLMQTSAKYQTSEVEVKGDLCTYSIALEIPAGDVVFQSVLIKFEKLMDAATYPIIQYDGLLPETQFSIKEDVPVINDTMLATANQPIAPRMWPSGLTRDETPDYPTDCPNDEDIHRTGFHLLGYTMDPKKRFQYDPSLEFRTAIWCTYPKQIRFKETGNHEMSTGKYLAMWKPDQEYLRSVVNVGLSKHGIHDQPETEEGPAVPFESATTISTRFPTHDMNMREVHSSIYKSLSIDYTFTNVVDFLNILEDINIPEGYTHTAYLFPEDVISVIIQNQFMDDEDTLNRKPDGAVKLRSWPFNAQMNRYELHETSSVDFLVGKVNTAAVVVYPKESYGLSPYYQAFQTFVINVVVSPKYLKATIILPGELKGKNWDPRDVRDIRLSELDRPEDAKDLTVVVNDDKTITLTGAMAGKYTLDPNYNIEYRQKIRIRHVPTNIDRDEIDEWLDFQFTSFARFDIKASKDYMLSSLIVLEAMVAKSDKDGNITMFTDRDDVIPQNSYGSKIRVIHDGDIFHVMIDEVVDDLEFTFIEKRFTINSPESCSRCKEYVDLNTEEFKWLDIEPKCTEFIPYC